MNARVTCVSCGQAYQVPAEALSKTMRCAFCGALFRAAQAPQPVPPPLPVMPVAAPIPAIPIGTGPVYAAPASGTSWQPWIWGGAAFLVLSGLAVGVVVSRFQHVQITSSTPKVTPAPRYIPPPPAPRQPTFTPPPPPPRPVMPSTRAATRPAVRTVLVGPVQVTLPARGASRSRLKNGIHNTQWTPYTGNGLQQADYSIFIVTEPQVEASDATPPLKEGDTFCSVSDWGVGPKAAVDTVTLKDFTYTRVREGEVDRCYSAYIDGQKVSVFHTAADTDNAAAGRYVRVVVESLQKRKTPLPGTRPVPVERP